MNEGTMIIKTVTVGELATNCYIAGDEKGVVIIDPGADSPQILKTVSSVPPSKIGGQAQWPVASVILTHAHPDHIGAVDEVAGKLKCPIYMHGLDSDWLKGIFGSKFPGLHVVEEGGIIKAGGVPFTILHTPGHSEGSICLYNEKEKVLFSGDTLFADGTGRTDLPGGDEEKMTASLKRLLALPAAVTVYPGHGEAALISEIRGML